MWPYPVMVQNKLRVGTLELVAMDASAPVKKASNTGASLSCRHKHSMKLLRRAIFAVATITAV